MVANFHKSEFNYGVFTTTDIAAILKQTTRTVNRYIKEYGDTRFSRILFNNTYTWEVDGVRAVNFYALIELAVFFLLRDKYDLSIHQINEARATMASTLNTPYPLAMYPVLTGEKTIFYEYLGELIRTDKRNKNQITLRAIVRPLLDKIEFDEDNVALKYYPLGKDAEVVVDPKHQFGQPTIKGTNIRVDVLAQMFENGESEKSLQSLYELTPKQVSDALRYYRQAA